MQGGWLFCHMLLQTESGLQCRRIFALSFQASLASLSWLRPNPTCALEIQNYALPSASSSGPVNSLVLLDTSTLVYERPLGAGSFKSVYVVSIGTADDDQKRFALAVQRLRQRSDVKDGLKGIQIAEELQRRLSKYHERQYFESILDWWFQESPPLKFQKGQLVFGDRSCFDKPSKIAPHSFLGTRWLFALKPVYDMDLREFCRQAHNFIKVGFEAVATRNEITRSVAGIALTGEGAIAFAVDLLRAGDIMHSIGLVHRDIKPHNIMLSNGRPVIIDFGFASFVKPGKDSRVCIQEPGRLKGEIQYVLARDVAVYKGCQEGDAFAFGKTLYQVVFGFIDEYATQSARETITLNAAQAANDSFRRLIQSDASSLSSRFVLSQSKAEILLEVVRGLCREDVPLTLSQAKQWLIKQGSHSHTE